MAFDPVTALVDIGSKVIDRIWPDPTQAAAAKIELLKMQQTGELTVIAGQMEINKIEAASGSTFVSGWRPFVGWVCGVGCGWNWIGLPIALFICEALGRHVAMAPADLQQMLPLLMGMLGLGGLRTYEKVAGVARV